MKFASFTSQAPFSSHQKAVLALSWGIYVRRYHCAESWLCFYLWRNQLKPTNRLVSFTVLGLVFLSPCNTHSVDGPPSFVSIPFVWRSTNCFTLFSLLHFGHFLNDSMFPNFVSEWDLDPLLLQLVYVPSRWSSIFPERRPEPVRPHVCIWLPVVFAVCHLAVNFLLQSFLAETSNYVSQNCLQTGQKDNDTASFVFHICDRSKKLRVCCTQ